MSSLQWQADVIPGLFQTEDYARQLSAAYQTVVPTTPPSVFDRFVQARMRRQERLTHEPVLQLSVVLDEAVLLRRVGDRGVMRAQLERLADVADMPNVDLRVMPLDREIALLAGSFVIMSFGSRSSARGCQPRRRRQHREPEHRDYTSRGRPNHLYRLFFQALAKASLSSADSRNLIVTTIERAWS